MSCPLGGDERRPQELVELAVADEVLLEPLDLLRQVGALAPHVLEAVGHLRQEPVDAVPLVAGHASPEADVSDLDWGKRHGASSQCSRPRIACVTICSTSHSTITPIIGERSSGPSGGRIRRKIRRYGSQTSYRNRCTRLSE